MNIARQQSYFPDLLCVETQDLKALLDIKSMYATVIPNYKQTELNVLSRLGFKHHVDLLKTDTRLANLQKRPKVLIKQSSSRLIVLAMC